MTLPLRMDFGKLIDKRQWNAREKNQSPVTFEELLIVTHIFFFQGKVFSLVGDAVDSCG